MHKTSPSQKTSLNPARITVGRPRSVEKDVTDQRVINALLETSFEYLSLQEQLDRALDVVFEIPWLSSKDGGAIFLADPESGDLVLQASRNLHPNLLVTCKHIKLGVCLCGRAAQTGEVVFASWLSADHDITFDGMHPHGHYCVPIRSRDGVIGVLNLYVVADHQAHPEEKIFLSSFASSLAKIIERRLAEKTLSQSRDGNEVFKLLLESAMEPAPLQDQLDQVLTMLFYLPWLPIQPMGAVFLLDEVTDELVLYSYTNNLSYLLKSCARVPLGRCLCGQAAKTRTMVHVSQVDERHEIEDEKLWPHGHCCIPILDDQRLLGVITLYLHEGDRLNAVNTQFLHSVASVLSIVIVRKQLDAQVLRALEDQREANQKLDRVNQFIRKTFGRYMSDEIVASILETPDGLQLGGEKKRVTVMMSDLRGFTALSEKWPAEDVVTMLNMYLEAMTEIILQYNGTIIEFLGDGILTIFGTPVTREDDAQRAVACALEMQKAMVAVNMRNRQHGYPNFAMGLGINTGYVIAGNIGSIKRSKYGVVGTTINRTARIESLTVGGQVLVSADTLQACGPILRIDDQWEMVPKGVPHAIAIYLVGGIDGAFGIHLPKPETEVFQLLATPLSVSITVMEGKFGSLHHHPSQLTAIGLPRIKLVTALEVERMASVQLQVFDTEQNSITDQLHGKVVRENAGKGYLVIHLTSIPAEVEKILLKSCTANNKP